jgi:hypothetical protein
MISDTLSDAIAEIDRYLSDPAFVDVYSPEMRGRLGVLRTRMDAIRAELDAAPVPPPPQPISRGTFAVLLGTLPHAVTHAILLESLCSSSFPDDMWESSPQVLLACVVRVLLREPGTVYSGAQAGRIREAARKLVEDGAEPGSEESGQ